MKRLISTIIISLICLCSAYACSSDTTIKHRFPESALASAPLLEGDTVFRFQGQDSRMSAYYRNGRIITITSKGDKLIHVLDLNTGDTVFTTLDYGAEGDKFITVFPRVYHDTLVLADHLKQQTVFLNLDSLAESGKYNPKILKLTMDKVAPFPTVIRYSGGRLLGLNPYCFKTDDGRFNNGDDRRFILSDSNMVFPEFGKYKYYTLNVAQGNVLANPDKNRVIFLHNNMDLMEVYEYTSLKKLYEINGPTEVVNDFGDFGNGTIVIYGQKNRGHMCAAGHDEWLITAFSSKLTTYLLQTDWNGRLIKTYCIGKNIPYDLSLSEDGKYLYSKQYTTGDRQVLVRYEL